MRTESIAGAITDNNDHSHSTTDASDGVRFIATLITIPGEIFLQIASLLDVADVISLRKTCTIIYHLTHDRSLWSSLLQCQQYQLPLPASAVRDIPAFIASLSSEELEHLVISNDLTDRTWLLPRHPPISLNLSPCCSVQSQYKVEDGGTKTILLIEVFLDRWLLSVSHERLVEVWDLHPGASWTNKWRDGNIPPTLHISRRLPGTSMFLSCTACLNEDDNTLILAVTSNFECTFIRIQPPKSDNSEHPLEAQLEIVVVVPTPAPMLVVRAVYPPAKLAFFSYSDSYFLINWETLTNWIVDVPDREEEELWNGVIGARFLTAHHIICVRAHTVELCTLLPKVTSGPPLSDSKSSATSTHIEAQVLTHPLSSTTFRGASCSAPQLEPFPSLSGSPSPFEPPDVRMSISFLAYDVLRGLFHYRVTLVLPSPSVVATPRSSLPPHMSVRLVAAHYTAVPYNSPIINNETGVARIPRSGLSPGTRGFISACVLGPEAKRGVWVERRRGSVRRGVVGFRVMSEPTDDLDRIDEEPITHTIRLENVSDSGEESEGVKEQNWWEDAGKQIIDGQTVYEVNSYDLRDDITHCTFSEVTGTIILGTRNGEIRIL
ncbi:hypothetical protein AcV5_002701 [Taiwanofungus camphoratus]|nr:hypothetical protein AcV5_002701 [Antrodia cinnamomea]KAI0947017.1 hypothetical protein AcV7_009569 [Antrodia cinnamomea]